MSLRSRYAVDTSEGRAEAYETGTMPSLLLTYRPALEA